MEILTVKNNKMDYSTFKKIIILFFPTKYKIPELQAETGNKKIN